MIEVSGKDKNHFLVTVVPWSGQPHGARDWIGEAQQLGQVWFFSLFLSPRQPLDRDQRVYRDILLRSGGTSFLHRISRNASS